VPRPRRTPRPGIGLPFIGGAAGALGFAVVYMATSAIGVSLVGGVVIGIAGAIYFGVRRRRRRT
jgi:hypothetical protein